MTSRDHFNPIGYGTPMTDIVERLRDPSGDIFPMCREAADEIERLNDALTDYHRIKKLGRADAADNARLRAALQALADDDAVPPWIRTLARRALEPQP